MGWKTKYITLKKGMKLKNGDIVILERNPNPETESWETANVGRELRVHGNQTIKKLDQFIEITLPLEHFEFEDDITEEDVMHDFVVCQEAAKYFVLVKK